MSEGLSRREGTTASMCIDLGTYAEEAYDIYNRSKALTRETPGDRTPEDRIRQRRSVVASFINAQESKHILRTLDVPSISSQGTRGGPPVAVASLNVIITAFSEMGHDGSGH